MTSTLSLGCPEKGCEVRVIGYDAEELTEMLKFHKHSKHWNLGRLPNEILIKILGHVVPDCKECFRQREILRLGSVSKRFYELTRAAVLYRDINLTHCDDHPTPPMTMIYRIIEASGPQLKKLLLTIPGKNYAWYEQFNVLRQEFAKVLALLKGGNLTALNQVELKQKNMTMSTQGVRGTHTTTTKLSIQITLNKMTNKEPIFERLQNLRIDFDCWSFQSEVIALAVAAIDSIRSLKQVVICGIFDNQNFKHNFEAKYSKFNIEIPWSESTEQGWVCSIRRKSDLNLVDPELSFKIFFDFLEGPFLEGRKFIRKYL